MSARTDPRGGYQATGIPTATTRRLNRVQGASATRRSSQLRVAKEGKEAVHRQPGRKHGKACALEFPTLGGSPEGSFRPTICAKLFLPNPFRRIESSVAPFTRLNVQRYDLHGHEAVLAED